ncbi:MAG: damage-inducible protein CinA [Desulfuromonas sp.]|uniref:CinA family nicotinamide mononucleotide deamidase-related protein n=1 Tax=Desulfuromonas sp. TaxID=892 RepID=UPI000CB28EBD|nr:CinA family nicotinamide mononucleotide deamidase-related protein [Desulfuromonas sp.]PLX86288.1 MAG: damage-inducible protein CinA [Desulfuromonas sp.]
MDVKIAVLAIGDELLSGEMDDTNTARIARLLGARGLALRESRTVGDAEEDIAEAMRHLAERHQAVIVTGGLGPTADDLTARAAARAFGRRLALHDEALRQIREHFRRKGRPMHPGNEKQALLPQKVAALVNTRGTAPGFVLRHGATDLFFLPGVPSEMTVMLEASVLPRLQARSGEAFPREERILQVFGISEPKTEELLTGADLPEGVSIAFGVEFPLVLVKLRAGGQKALSLLDRAELEARQALGDHVVGPGGESLAKTVARLFTARSLTLALAESCTGGLVAKLLTDIPGASTFLERGAVTYANSAKRDWLQVPETVLLQPGAVSEACALAMARGIREAAGTDLGLAITGIAGPGGGMPQKPVGTVFIALSTARGEQARRHHFAGNREQVRILAAYTALDWLRRHLGALPAEPNP